MEFKQQNNMIRDADEGRAYATCANCIDSIEASLDELRHKPVRAVGFVAMDAEGAYYICTAGAPQELMQLFITAVNLWKESEEIN